VFGTIDQTGLATLTISPLQAPADGGQEWTTKKAKTKRRGRKGKGGEKKETAGRLRRGTTSYPLPHPTNFSGHRVAGWRMNFGRKKEKEGKRSCPSRFWSSAT